MAFIHADRVKESTTTTGTGTITLGGAATGFRAFSSSLAVNDTTVYCIEDTATGAWEVGVGTLATTSTLARTSVISSSNANALVSFAAGTKSVFITMSSLKLDSNFSATPPANTVNTYATNDDGIIRLEYKDPNGNSIRLGRDQFLTVRNNSGGTLTKGDWVYVSGANLQRVRVDLAKADNETTAPAIGMMMDTITNGADGRCCISGLVPNIDTSTFSDGQRLFLSATVAGGEQATAPTTGFKQRVGVVINAHATNGVMLVCPAGLSPRQTPEGYFWPQETTGVPATPTDGLAIFTRLIAGRRLLAQVGPSGLDTALQPFLARNKVGYWNPPGNANTVPGVFGITAPTVVGTATARTVATTSLSTRMRRLGYVSAATTAAFSAQYINTNQFSAGSGSLTDGSGFMLIARWVPSNAAAVSGERFYMGVGSNVAAPTNVEPNTLTNHVGIAQLSTDATQFYLVYGGSAAQTAIAMGAGLGDPTVRSTTAYELAIFCPPNTANTFNVLVTNLTTGATYSNTLTGASTVVPQSTTLLSWRTWKTNNATALAVATDLCSLYIETDT